MKQKKSTSTGGRKYQQYSTPSFQTTYLDEESKPFCGRSFSGGDISYCEKIYDTPFLYSYDDSCDEFEYFLPPTAYNIEPYPWQCNVSKQSCQQYYPKVTKPWSCSKIPLRIGSTWKSNIPQKEKSAKTTQSSSRSIFRRQAKEETKKVWCKANYKYDAGNESESDYEDAKESLGDDVMNSKPISPSRKTQSQHAINMEQRNRDIFPSRRTRSHHPVVYEQEIQESSYPSASHQKKEFKISKSKSQQSIIFEQKNQSCGRLKSQQLIGSDCKFQSCRRTQSQQPINCNQGNQGCRRTRSQQPIKFDQSNQRSKLTRSLDKNRPHQKVNSWLFEKPSSDLRQEEIGDRPKRLERSRYLDNPMAKSYLQRLEKKLVDPKFVDSKQEMKRIDLLNFEKVKVEHLVTQKFQQMFRAYAKVGNLPGIVISKTRSHVWQKRSGLYDDIFNSQHASDSFSRLCGRKSVMNVYDYMYYLVWMSQEQGAVIVDVITLMLNCPKPLSSKQVSFTYLKPSLAPSDFRKSTDCTRSSVWK